MQSLSCRSSTSLLRTRHIPAAPRLTTLRPARRLSLLDERGMARCCADSKSAEYNKIMTEKMKWDPDNPYKYDFERGLYYHHILQDELLCGSQPTNADDVRYLAQAEKVDTMVSLQEEKDPHHWGVDVNAVHGAMHDAGMRFARVAVRDFDPGSLRYCLRQAAYEIARDISEGRKVYVHCTAGLGRAPAACIAYMFWFRDFTLDEAYEHLTKIRPCGPKREAIRGATYDILSGGDWDTFDALPPHAYSCLSEEDRHMLQYHVLGGRDPRA